jgi:hypothetical protein
MHTDTEINTDTFTHVCRERQMHPETEREHTHIETDAYRMLHAHRDIDIHGNTHKHELTDTETEVHIMVLDKDRDRDTQGDKKLQTERYREDHINTMTEKDLAKQRERHTLRHIKRGVHHIHKGIYTGAQMHMHTRRQRSMYAQICLHKHKDTHRCTHRQKDAHYTQINKGAQTHTETHRRSKRYRDTWQCCLLFPGHKAICDGTSPRSKCYTIIHHDRKVIP